MGNAAVTELVRSARLTRQEQEQAPDLTPFQRCVIDLARRYEPDRVPVPAGMSGTAAFAVGPLREDESEDLLRSSGSSPQEAQRDALDLDPELSTPPLERVELIYTNDGTGIFPNFGGGSDHGRTAGVGVQFHYDNQELGLVQAGYNLEIWTPQKGGPAEDGFYPGGPGGYKGLFFVDFDYRVARSGDVSVHLLTELGTNSEWLGELVQSRIVHQPLGIPLFQWGDRGAEFYGAVGGKVATIQDLIDLEGAAGTLRLRLLLDADAMAGTHESSTGTSGTLVLRAGRLGIDGLRGSLRVSIGASGRVVGRYRDRGGARIGVEGTVSNEIGVEFDDLSGVAVIGAILRPEVPGTLGVSIGGRSTRGTMPSAEADPGEDAPSTSGAWAGPGSRSEGVVKATYTLRF